MSKLLGKLALIKQGVPRLQRNKKMIIQKADPDRGKKEFGVWYCTEDLLRDTIEPILQKHGVYMAVHGGPASGTEHKEEFAFSARFTFVDIESGEEKSYEHPAGGAIGAGMTTATRLFLERFFNVKSYDPGYVGPDPDNPSGEKKKSGGKRDEVNINAVIKKIIKNANLYKNQGDLYDAAKKNFKERGEFIRQCCLALSGGNRKDAIQKLIHFSSINGQGSSDIEKLMERSSADIMTTFLNVLRKMDADIDERLSSS